MSCLSGCGCKYSDQDIETAQERTAHVEASYQPLLEASNAPEAIPLLPKDPTMHKYEAQQQQYQVLALIGLGLNQAAHILLARHVPSSHHVAIRRIDLEMCSEDITYVQREILLTRQLRHENLLPYYNSFVTGYQVWVVMPLMIYGSAQSLLKNQFPDGLPEIAIAFILRDVLSALFYLHKRGFIHRSVRASHILLNGNGRAVLGGLRYSCNMFKGGRWQNYVHAYPHDAKPNLNWLSPELLHQNMLGYSAKSDVYSVGVTALELRSGVVPFVHLAPTQMLLEKLAPDNHSLNYPLDSRSLYSTTDHASLILVDSNGSQGFANHQMNKNQKGPNMSGNNSDGSNNSVYVNHVYSEAFTSFVHLCLQKDTLARPSAAQMINHSFIKQCKKSQISMLDILAKATHLIEKYGNSSVEVAETEEKEEEVPVERLETLELIEDWNF